MNQIPAPRRPRATKQVHGEKLKKKIENTDLMYLGNSNPCAHEDAATKTVNRLRSAPRKEDRRGQLPQPTSGSGRFGPQLLITMVVALVIASLWVLMESVMDANQTPKHV